MLPNKEASWKGTVAFKLLILVAKLWPLSKTMALDGSGWHFRGVTPLPYDTSISRPSRRGILAEGQHLPGSPWEPAGAYHVGRLPGQVAGAAGGSSTEAMGGVSRIAWDSKMVF